LDAESGKVVYQLKEHRGRVNAIACNPAVEELAIYDDQDIVSIWSLAKGTLLRSIDTGPVRNELGSPTLLAYSPDGKMLVASRSKRINGKDCDVRIWDSATGALEVTLQGHSAIVQSVAFTPDGRRLWTASEDRTIKLWDAGSGQQLRSFPVSQIPYLVAFSPDGMRLVAGFGRDDADGKIVLWDASPTE
jgi:WD40 repeat protein